MAAARRALPVAPEVARAPDTCVIHGCVAPKIAKGMCSAHYYRLRRGGSLDTNRKRPVEAGKKISTFVEGEIVDEIEKAATEGDKTRHVVIRDILYAWYATRNPAKAAALQARIAAAGTNVASK